MREEEQVGAAYCGRCGCARDDADHTVCESRRRHDPPRYCARCGRRMVVQVTPSGWAARCSRHGEITSQRQGS